ncbi:hypothetical protein Pmani_024625 [Petrolisthes manimaculis]|uniref:G-protein coupled receptors family 1 profile domain-containing protein n=1 Tax=Petrolisthes manimaculis TaxID=1843537 RepID=A0AAE1P781_9EUCA|nr:hypothetical protein Pmani_024625 [Petrolisthes manimaculis]
MASPTIESLCCLSSKNAFSKDFLSDFQSVPYNVVSILAAVLGISGALYQMVPWFHQSEGNNSIEGSRSRGGRSLRTRGRAIIQWLALADLLASLGILIRSASWLADDTFGSNPDDSTLGQCFCIVTSAMIHYFYTATYMWSFVYALDVRLAMSPTPPPPSTLYHLLAWVPPLALCLLGLLVLYLPDLNCHSESVNPYMRFLPNYLSSFLPIVFVMLVNPVLYCLAFSRVQTQIVSVRGRYTQSERKIVDGLFKKFFMINLVFYVCWLPNIINGVVLWTAWDNLPKVFILTVWYMMAVLNPLQAVLNSVVYRRWSSGPLSPRHHQNPLPSHSWPLQAPTPTPHPHDLSDDDDDEDDADPKQSPISVPQHLHHERTPLLPHPQDSPQGIIGTNRRSNRYNE